MPRLAAEARPKRVSYVAQPAIYQGTPGMVVEIQGEILWWVAGGSTEKVFFSLRRDGLWRAFPGPADGPGLQIKGR